MKKIILLAVCFYNFTFIVNSQILTENDLILSSFTPKEQTDDYLIFLKHDLNGDGEIDLLLDGGMGQAVSAGASKTKNAILLLGDGKGNFTQSQYYLKPSNIHNITDFGDYNKDGFVDMLMYHYWSNGFYLYTGNGNGIMSFNTNPKLYRTGTHGGETKFVDYDNDGDLDIFSLSAGSARTPGFHVFENNNNVFTKTSYFTTSNRLFTFERYTFYKDFNNDKLIDALVYDRIRGGNLDGASLFMQNADHSFSELVLSDDIFSKLGPSWHTDNKFQGLTVGDVNNDNQLDIIFETLKSFNGRLDKESKLAVYYGSTLNPTFYDFSSEDASITIPLNHPYSNSLTSSNNIKLEDIDADGNLDLISHHEAPNNGLDELAIYLNPFNTATATNPIKISYKAEGLIKYKNSVLIEDINKDGKKDLIALTEGDHTIRAFIQKKTLSTKSVIDMAKIKIYPNPTTNKVLIKYNNANTISAVKVYNTIGTEIFNKKGKITTIDLSNFSEGIYFVKIENTDGVRATYKIIKK